MTGPEQLERRVCALCLIKSPVMLLRQDASGEWYCRNGVACVKRMDRLPQRRTPALMPATPEASPVPPPTKSSHAKPRGAR